MIKLTAPLPAIENYVCYHNGCDWSTKKENTDWAYYSKTNGECMACVGTCNNDSNCGGIECGGGYCSWWRKGACMSHELKPVEDPSVTTCLNTTAGKYFK